MVYADKTFMTQQEVRFTKNTAAWLVEKLSPAELTTLTAILKSGNTSDKQIPDSMKKLAKLMKKNKQGEYNIERDSIAIYRAVTDARVVKKIAALGTKKQSKPGDLAGAMKRLSEGLEIVAEAKFKLVEFYITNDKSISNEQRKELINNLKSYKQDSYAVMNVTLNPSAPGLNAKEKTRILNEIKSLEPYFNKAEETMNKAPKNMY